MMKFEVIRLLCIFAIASNSMGCIENKNSSAANGSSPKKLETTLAESDSEDINFILNKIDASARQIKTYQVKISYLFSQPLLESQTLRTGMLYYLNNEKTSKLRINFDSVKYDDDPVQKYNEQYIFDGINLTRINYPLKYVEIRQLAEPNKPINAFDLAKENIPIIGFSKANKLKDDFEIGLIKSGSDSDKQTRLRLVAKSQSKFSKDYKELHIWVDKKRFLPFRMTAVTQDEDFYDIMFSDAKINKNLDNHIFDVAVPKDFSKNIVPLEKREE